MTSLRPCLLVSWSFALVSAACGSSGGGGTGSSPDSGMQSSDATTPHDGSTGADAKRSPDAASKDSGTSPIVDAANDRSTGMDTSVPATDAVAHADAVSSTDAAKADGGDANAHDAANVSADAGTCDASGETCCTTGGVSSCSGSLVCAGAECSCIVACSGNRVQRSDGTLWTSGASPVKTASNELFVATNFSAGGVGLQCAVQADGSAWCWGGNSVGQLGNNGAASGTSPVQVVTATGPLANVTKIFVDASGGEVSCAIDASANVWCWGYGAFGALGNGSTAESLVATPVLTASGGTQFTGATDLAVAHDHVCARKTDGSLWCWGNNGLGQIGVGTTQASYPYPTQVTALANVTSISVATGLSCATTTSTTGNVWCWGQSSYGQIGNGKQTVTATSPSAVLTSADAGMPFTGAKQVAVGSSTVCTLQTADRSMWCWGTGGAATGYVPSEYSEEGAIVRDVFVMCDNNQVENFPTFIDKNGLAHMVAMIDSQVTCP